MLDIVQRMKYMQNTKVVNICTNRIENGTIEKRKQGIIKLSVAQLCGTR